MSQALGKSERVADIISECASELSSLNAGLKRELGDRELVPAVKDALEASEVVEDKVQDASEKIAIVNQALKKEVHERQLLEAQLAAVTEQNEQAHHASLHDPLTGLPNRALFNDRLEHGLAYSTRHGLTFAVMFMDLDNFKAINDAHGHDVGDMVLTTVAARLKDATRDEDTVCRHGGDEFLYIMMNVRDAADVALIARRIITAVQAPCEMRVRDQAIELVVRASIGIALFPHDGNSADALLDSADKAMYRAKRAHSGYAFSDDTALASTDRTQGYVAAGVSQSALRSL